MRNWTISRNAVSTPIASARLSRMTGEIPQDISSHLESLMLRRSRCADSSPEAVAMEAFTTTCELDQLLAKVRAGRIEADFETCMVYLQSIELLLRYDTARSWAFAKEALYIYRVRFHMGQPASILLEALYSFVQDALESKKSRSFGQYLQSAIASGASLVVSDGRQLYMDQNRLLNVESTTGGREQVAVFQRGDWRRLGFVEFGVAWAETAPSRVISARAFPVADFGVGRFEIDDDWFDFLWLEGIAST